MGHQARGGLARLTPGDELVEVVDVDGTVVDVVARRRMRAENLRHRAVFVAVLDPAGRLLVHRRSAAKDVWPGWWDVAVGGVVAVGESFEAAAERELAEEVGIGGVIPVPLGSGSYEDDHVRVVGHMYAVRWDGPVVFADGEVVEACWVHPDELAARRRHGHRYLPDSLALLLPLLDGWT